MKWIEWNEISGFRIGHSQDKEGGTGCTVILCPQGATAGVEVRGGGPATRETDLLNPKNMVQKIHAVTLSGGSAFGLEAGSGVMQYLSEHQIGFDMKGIYIPIVCQASLFDCGLGNPKAYPDKAMGYQACVNSESIDLSQGNIGAGMGASVGKAFGFEKAMKTGLGHACVQVDQLKVGAIVALNACGDIYQANSTKWLAGSYDRKKRKPIYTVDALIDGMENQSNAHENTTIGCIFTNADLNKAQMNKVASLSHNAYAHCIHPVATSNDGDTIFAMATNEVVADMDLVGLLAIKAMEKAIEKAALYANAAYDLFSASDV